MHLSSLLGFRDFATAFRRCSRRGVLYGAGMGSGLGSLTMPLKRLKVAPWNSAAPDGLSA